MGKRSQKLLVYLDQNFLSEMSKADINEKVRPEFKEIYELLHQGFVDEKLVVPGSMLHDIESSLATHLKDRIVSYQHYLGQVRLYRPDEITNTQTFAALDRFTVTPNTYIVMVSRGHKQDELSLRKVVGLPAASGSLGGELLNAFLGCVLVYSALFGVGQILLRSAAIGLGLLVVSALAAYAIARNLSAQELAAPSASGSPSAS